MKSISKCESFNAIIQEDIFTDDQWNLEEDFLSEGGKIQSTLSSDKLTKNMSNCLQKKNIECLNNSLTENPEIVNAVDFTFRKKRELMKSQFSKQDKNWVESNKLEEQKKDEISIKSWKVISLPTSLKGEISMLLKILSKK